jgi:hypothetical protein
MTTVHRDAVLSVAARFVSQAERRCNAQARTVEELSMSPEGRPVAERMLDEMRHTLALARLYEDFLRTMDDISG